MNQEKTDALNKQISIFIIRCNPMVAAIGNGYPGPTPFLGFEPLVLGDHRRYLRIVRTDYAGAKSAYCFINSLSGGVYKASGWRAPQRNALRGSILAESPEIFMDGFGPRYLR